jgi:NADH-quinone oxidoreductase subunit L
MIVSVAVAVTGIFLARQFYLNRPQLAAEWTKRLQPLYKLSFNKWYWDWLLDVKGVEAGKAVNNGLWKVDSAVVDGGVNGAGALTRLWARISNLWDKYVVDLLVNATGWTSKAGSIVLRTVQTGFWQNYALVFALGLLIILGFYVYPAVSTTFKALFGKQ